jgi:hypothetical protein
MPIDTAKPDRPREALLRALSRHTGGLNLKQLSRALGRNDAYLHQYLNRGSPRQLPETLRAHLALLLNIDERELCNPQQLHLYDQRESNDFILIPVLQGDGSLAHNPTLWPFCPVMLARITAPPYDRLACIRIESNAMAPQLNDGDMALLDREDTDPSRPGLFFMDDTLTRGPKRLELVAGSAPPIVRILSGNPLYANYRRPLSEIRLLGRILWYAHQIE